MGRTCRAYGMRCVYRVLMGKQSLVRPRGRWDDNIKMDLREVGCGGVDWFG